MPDKPNGVTEGVFQVAEQDEIDAFLSGPDAVRLTEERKVVLQMTVANCARIGYVLTAAAEAVPEDPVLAQLALQICNVVADQITILIRQQSAKVN